MPRARRMKNDDSSTIQQAPSMSLEARENQLILLATNLAEKRLRDGTATSPIIAHYLRLGTTRERLEQEKLKSENELAKAKTESYQASKDSKELYKEALAAFRRYSGHGSTDQEDLDDW